MEDDNKERVTLEDGERLRLREFFRNYTKANGDAEPVTMKPAPATDKQDTFDKARGW